jgi:hypothetical protein
MTRFTQNAGTPNTSKFLRVAELTFCASLLSVFRYWHYTGVIEGYAAGSLHLCVYRQ